MPNNNIFINLLERINSFQEQEEWIAQYEAETLELKNSTKKSKCSTTGLSRYVKTKKPLYPSTGKRMTLYQAY
jgi:hypothetical protein